MIIEIMHYVIWLNIIDIVMYQTSNFYLDYFVMWYSNEIVFYSNIQIRNWRK